MRVIEDLKDGAVLSAIYDIESDLVARKPDEHDYHSWSEYQLAVKAWQLKRVLDRISVDEVWDADSFRSAIECKEMYVKEGIYYYKKSRGESVSPEEVLAMSWSEVLEYRKSVAVNATTKHVSTPCVKLTYDESKADCDLVAGDLEMIEQGLYSRFEKTEKKPENVAVTTAIATMRNACAPGVKLVYDESKIDSVPAGAGLEEVAQILNFRFEKDDEPKSNSGTTAMSW